MNDMINHPPHYGKHPSGVKCITITEHMNFCKGNAVKYIWRAGEKGDEVEDLKKARWYIDREIQRLTSDREKAAAIAKRRADAESEASDLEATADEIMAAATVPDDAPTSAEALQAEREEMLARVGPFQSADLTPYTDALNLAVKEIVTDAAGEPIDVADIKVGDRVSAWFGGSSPERIKGVVKGSTDGYLTVNGMIIRFSSGKIGTLMSDIRKLS